MNYKLYLYIDLCRCGCSKERFYKYFIENRK